jgi:hypothetical protein
VDASIGAAFSRLIGLSVSLAGLQRRAEGRRRGLASCPNWVKRCRAHRGLRSRAASLIVPSLRPGRGRPPDRNRLKSVWRGAVRSPSAQPRHVGVSDDGRAAYHRVRDAQRPRCPFQSPSSRLAVLEARKARKNWFAARLCNSETEEPILHTLGTLCSSVRAWGATFKKKTCVRPTYMYSCTIYILCWDYLW